MGPGDNSLGDSPLPDPPMLREGTPCGCRVWMDDPTSLRRSYRYGFDVREKRKKSTSEKKKYKKEKYGYL